MPLSTEKTFSRMAFPQLQKQDTVAENEGYVHGHSAGYAAGLRAAEAEQRIMAEQLEAAFSARSEGQRVEADRTLAVLNSAVRALHARNAPVLSAAEDVLAAAAIELAEAILGYELSDGGKSARSALARAIAGAAAAEVVTVRMNPADLAILDDNDIRKAEVRLTADAALAPGDAVAVLPDGLLDARIGTALARAKQALAGENP
jgi:flagellar assembly protein FliH